MASSKWLENKLKHHIYLPLLIIDVILHEHPVTVFGKLDPSIHNLLSKHVAEGAAGDPASKYITHSAIPMTVPELRSIRVRKRGFCHLEVIDGVNRTPPPTPPSASSRGRTLHYGIYADVRNPMTRTNEGCNHQRVAIVATREHAHYRTRSRDG